MPLAAGGTQRAKQGVGTMPQLISRVWPTQESRRSRQDPRNCAIRKCHVATWLRGYVATSIPRSKWQWLICPGIAELRSSCERTSCRCASYLLRGHQLLQVPRHDMGKTWQGLGPHFYWPKPHFYGPDIGPCLSSGFLARPCVLLRRLSC